MMGTVDLASDRTIYTSTLLVSEFIPHWETDSCQPRSVFNHKVLKYRKNEYADDTYYVAECVPPRHDTLRSNDTM